MSIEKLEGCPNCNTLFSDDWEYEVQRCKKCGYDSLRIKPFKPLHEMFHQKTEPSVPIAELKKIMYWGKSGAEYAEDLKALIDKYKGEQNG